MLKGKNLEWKDIFLLWDMNMFSLHVNGGVFLCTNSSTHLPPPSSMHNFNVLTLIKLITFQSLGSRDLSRASSSSSSSSLSASSSSSELEEWREWCDRVCLCRRRLQYASNHRPTGWMQVVDKTTKTMDQDILYYCFLCGILFCNFQNKI